MWIKRKEIFLGCQWKQRVRAGGFRFCPRGASQPDTECLAFPSLLKQVLTANVTLKSGRRGPVVTFRAEVRKSGVSY